MKIFDSIFASMMTIALSASAQTPGTPPTIDWDPSEVAVIFAADQDTFSEVFNDTKGNPVSAWTPAAWGQTCVVSEDECGDGAALRIDNLDFLPMQFVATADFTGYRYLHMDIWAANDDQMCVKFQNWWPGETFVSEVFNLTGGAWNSIDIDMDQADFTWTKKNEIPQHCVNVLQFAGERIPNDYQHSPVIYITNIMAHNRANSSVENIEVDDFENAVRYNIMGQPVDSTYKGIVICNGRKFIQR